MIVKMANLIAFNEFYEGMADKKLPLKILYPLKKTQKKVAEEFAVCQECLQAIIETYGEKDENGNFVLTEDQKGICIKQDKLQECQEKILELEMTDIEISDEYLIPLFDFDKMTEMTVAQFDMIAIFFKD